MSGYTSGVRYQQEGIRKTLNNEYICAVPWPERAVGVRQESSTISDAFRPMSRGLA
jgi:hypothetical protein